MLVVQLSTQIQTLRRLRVEEMTAPFWHRLSIKGSIPDHHDHKGAIKPMPGDPVAAIRPDIGELAALPESTQARIGKQGALKMMMLEAKNPGKYILPSSDMVDPEPPTMADTMNAAAASAQDNTGIARRRPQ